ncbi:hypothetical protein AKJ16_DCAP07654 [Drosera capensis]
MNLPCRPDSEDQDDPGTPVHHSLVATYSDLSVVPTEFLYQCIVMRILTVVQLRGMPGSMEAAEDNGVLEATVS